MRIGLLPGSRAAGGVYQYSVSMIEALDPAEAAAAGDELVLLHSAPPEVALEPLVAAGWRTATFEPPPGAARRAADVARRLVRERAAHRSWRRLRQRTGLVERPPDPDDVRARPDVAAWLRSVGVDLVFYPVPTTLSFEAGVPYVASVHDLQHRLQPEFPEVSADGQAEWREYLFRNLIRHATLVLVDSEVGKEDVIALYGEFGITADRIKVLPFVPPPTVASVTAADPEEIRTRYRLPDRYLFYPAQFWPHKNHARLLQALALLERDRGISASIVFCGTHWGELRKRTYGEVERLAHDLGLGARVFFLGYVPDEHIAALYRGAVALTIPTFFGPTNIPVVEAWALGCPVLTSDVRGIREHVADAALLADPRSVADIADTIERLWTDERLRRDLAERGRRRLEGLTAADFRAGLREILGEAKERVRREP